MTLQLKNIYGGYSPDQDILQGINLDVKNGEAVGIIGLNGSGKSTLGKAIMNMLPYRTGSLIFEGEDITEKKTSELSHRGICIFMQGGVVFDVLSVLDNLRLAADKLESIEAIKSYFVFLNLANNTLTRIKADKLSGGERHQLALAMTLLKNPSLLILDEPSAGLSPNASETIYKILDTIRIQRRLTIILIEQNIILARRFCDRLCLLEDGKFQQDITKEDIEDKIENYFI